MVSKPIDT